jgi:hypothetical protein
MGTAQFTGSGTAADPWTLMTPPGKSEYQAYRDESADPPALVVQVGSTQLRYHLRCIDDLHEMLRKNGDWMPLGSADEQKDAGERRVAMRRQGNCEHYRRRDERGRRDEQRPAVARCEAAQPPRALLFDLPLCLGIEEEGGSGSRRSRHRQSIGATAPGVDGGGDEPPFEG